MMRRLAIEVQGAVQGVGFRPFIFRLATELALSGWVVNDNRGVRIEVEGDEALLRRFLAAIEARPPRQARIESIDSSWRDAAGFERFEIRHSDGTARKTVMVLPDVATCAACLNELGAADNRRHNYPFTNCTDCGPRFSIVEALPYDRPHTTMAGFSQCAACQAEYDDPSDRRFHAQPNACPQCGPTLEAWGKDGEVLARADAALDLSLAAVERGEIVGLKGLGGFLLLVDATSDAAVATLRQRKQRPHKPLAVMVRDLQAARELAEISEAEAVALEDPAAAILLVPRRPDAQLAAGLAPDTATLGIMLPCSPLHHLLAQRLARPLVATSGNLNDEPICTDEREAVRRLAGIADLFLVHDRPISRHVDDSVARLLHGEVRTLRRARGLAPLPIGLGTTVPTVLAAGPHLKNSVALSLGSHVFVSQHIGDLQTLEAQAAFDRAATDLLRLYEAKPVAIAHDLHPDYVSTRWAHDASRGDGPLAGLPLIGVQHHHAHLAACLADNTCDGPALGITWDGTGFGRDGSIWGGEMLLGDASSYERVAHLRPFSLPGGDAAAREPRRAALALLWELDGEACLERDDLAPIRSFGASERQLLAQMLAGAKQTPRTTSAGRLFDGVAALVGLYPRASFEGQAAMALESMADVSVEDAYALPLVDAADATKILDWQPMLRAIIDEVVHGAPRPQIAARFHNALVAGIVAVARHIGCERVALTGGCFQNRWLTERSAEALTRAGFSVLLHRQVPPNDGGICLGQIMVAASRLDRG